MSSSPTVIDLDDRRAKALAAEITKLYGLISAATFEFLVKVREFDEDKLWAGPGIVSCAHWLNWQCGIGMNAAREKVRVARALGELPKISEAFRRGEVSFSKVRAMTRVATPDSEDYLLMIARHGTANHVETLVRGFRRAERLNEPDAAEQQVMTRCFHYRWDEDGSLVFNGRLPAEVGAMLLKALEASVDQNIKEVSAETSDEDGSDDSLSQKRADAIAEMAESYLANGPAESSSADRYQVMLHVYPEGTATAVTSESTCHREASERPWRSHGDCFGGSRLAMTGYIENGPHVSAVTSKRLCCDTSIIRIVEDEEGEPLSIGRKSRVIPTAMRRALKARDKQCRFPGCTHRHRIDGHHIRHWADGGDTELENLVMLCRFHHRLVHEGGYCCEKDNDGKVVFRDPQGKLIPEVGRVLRFSGNVIAHLREKLEDRFIDEQTIRPDWHGETMDNDLAVGHLWDIEHREALPRS